MDRSVDSIGSCSLDVDADSLDISDASGSLNFPTPISVKDITREFITNIRERCSVRTFANPESDEVCTVLTQPVSGVTKQSAMPVPSCDTNSDKKPSYLNLACCVNGYSNITTYDSKIRQNINKSRDVSPIRPSSSSIQYCKKNYALAPPVLHKMTTKNDEKAETPKGKTYVTSCEINNMCKSNGNGKGGNTFFDIDEVEQEKQSSTSFIQQRVERLYGPGALAQVFYSPKRVRGGKLIRVESPATTELSRKFQEISPCKDYSEFQKKISLNTPNSARNVVSPVAIPVRNDVDLPVLRHLSEEFLAQLPKISPNKNFLRNFGDKECSGNNTNDNITISGELSKLTTANDEVDHEIITSPANVEYILKKPSSSEDICYGNKKNKHPNAVQSKTNSSTNNSNVTSTTDETNVTVKDGHYFLSLLKAEQTRLLALAAEAEAHTEKLTNSTEVGEDILGLLRSASGRARLLVSQKMKQFEGLCHKNLNALPADKFPTTADDLQGFWDMVNLQIDHINLIFKEVDTLKKNNWEKQEQSIPIIKTNRQQKPTKASVISRNDTKNLTTVSSHVAHKRESQRKELQEMKRKNKLALAAKLANTDENESSLPTNSIAIFVSENCKSTSQ